MNPSIAKIIVDLKKSQKRNSKTMPYLLYFIQILGESLPNTIHAHTSHLDIVLYRKKTSQGHSIRFGFTKLFLAHQLKKAALHGRTMMTFDEEEDDEFKETISEALTILRSKRVEYFVTKDSKEIATGYVSVREYPAQLISRLLD